MRFLIPDQLGDVTAELAGGAIALGGGTVASPHIAAGHGGASTFVDVTRLPELVGVRTDPNQLTIGALTTLDAIHADPGVGQRCPALASAAGSVGNPQVRRAGTLGGSLALGIPIQGGGAVFGRQPHFVADVVAALLVLDAEVTLLGAAGTEVSPLAQLLVAGRGARQLITSVQLATPAGVHSGFEKFAWRQSSGKTIVNVAASFRLDGGRASQVRIAVGGQVSEGPRGTFTALVPNAEAEAEGHAWDDATIQRVVEAADAEVSFDHVSAPGPEYRRTLVRAGLQTLLSRLTG